MAGVRPAALDHGLRLSVGRPRSTVRRTAVDLASALVDGRAVVLAGNAAHSDTMSRFLLDAGASTILRLELPAPTGHLAHHLASVEQLLTDPPRSIMDELDRIDPDRQAYVYAGSFTAINSLCGRRVLGARSPQHFAAERKDVQDRLLGRNVGRIELTIDTLAEVARDVAAMARHAAVVVQGIPDTALAIGASHTFAIPRTAAKVTIECLLETIAQDCTAVTAAHLDHGTACTYYGLVTPIAVLDFGPFEALVYWDPDTWQVVAPGIARPTSLDADVEHACRSALHMMVHGFHQQTRYCGAFGTDGTVVGDSYRIHELNPRICAGFAVLDDMCQPPIPLMAIDLVLREVTAAAGPALAEPLGELTDELRAAQQPLIRLWNEPGQHLPAQVSGTARTTVDTADWTHNVRAALTAPSNLLPLAHLN